MELARFVVLYPSKRKDITNYLIVNKRCIINLYGSMSRGQHFSYILVIANCTKSSQLSEISTSQDGWIGRDSGIWQRSVNNLSENFCQSSECNLCDHVIYVQAHYFRSNVIKNVIWIKCDFPQLADKCTNYSQESKPIKVQRVSS